MTNSLNLSPFDSLIYSIIKQHKCISAREIGCRLRANEVKVENAISRLQYVNRLVVQNASGVPKRYGCKLEPSSEVTDEQQQLA